MKKLIITQSNYIPWKGFFDSMAAVTKFEVSFAGSFMSLAFVAILLLSALFFLATTLGKPLGLILVIGGIVATVKL